MATIKKIAEKNGWEFNKNYMYGKEGNCLITGRQVIDYMNKHNTCKKVFFTLSNMTEEKALKIQEYIKENKKELKIHSFVIGNQVIAIRLAEGLKGYSVEQFNQLTSSLVSFFQKHDMLSPTCVYCNNSEVNSVVRIDKIAFQAHHECVRKAQDELEHAKDNYKSVNKNYGRGMLGAVVGALIGSIPWVMLEIMWGYIAILSIVIGYAAFFGYKKFGGLVTGITKWLILISILFAVVVSNIASLTYYFIDENIAIMIDNYVIAYTDKEISSLLLNNLMLGTVFALLGFIPVFIKIKSEEFNQRIE